VTSSVPPYEMSVEQVPAGKHQDTEKALDCTQVRDRVVRQRGESEHRKASPVQYTTK